MSCPCGFKFTAYFGAVICPRCGGHLLINNKIVTVGLPKKGS